MKIRITAIMLLMSICAVGLVAAESKTQYYAIYMNDQKAGYAMLERQVSGGKVTTIQEMDMTISRGGIAINTTTTETAVETTKGQPLGFSSVQQMSFMQSRTDGTIDEQGTVHLTVTRGGQTTERTMQWPDGAVMMEGLRLIQKKKGLKQSTNYSVKVFAPQLLRAIETKIEVGPTEEVDLLGRVVRLTKVTSIMHLGSTVAESPGGAMTSISYVNAELDMLKNVMPILGIEVRMVACPEDFAKADNQPAEMISQAFIKSPKPLDPASARAIGYLLKPTNDSVDLQLPSTDNQMVKKAEDGSVAVKVSPVEWPSGGSFPYRGNDPELLEAVKPTSYLQSDDEEIIKLARQAIGDTDNASEAAQRIESFVGDYISRRSLSVGYASASEVAQTRQGDCTEFALLAAAMCRAVGIPAQVVMGVVYVDNFGMITETFGGHAWVRVYIDGKWVGLDSAFASAGLGGYGPGHIALALGHGDPGDFFNLINTVGQFTIEKAMVTK